MLASELDPEQYSVHAWFLNGGGPLAAELETVGAHVRVFEWQNGARDPAGAFRFWRALWGEKFAIVHQHFGGRAPRWLARSVTCAKIIAHVHGHILEGRGLSPLPMPARDADVTIATSRTVAEWIVGPRPHVVYPGVYVPRHSSNGSASSTTRRNMVLGTAGRLVPMKGIVYLIHAMAALRTDIPHIRLEIAGEGPLHMALEREVQLLGLRSCVSFLGWRKDLAAVMAGWDIYVQPSLVEPCGMAILEAMALGLPVVATSSGGPEELLEDGRTGWLVPPGHSVALADCLRALLLDPERRRVAGVAGRAHVREHFSSDRMVTAISKLYDSLLEGA